MKMRIVPVREENRQAALALSVFPHQAGFIETVEECLQEADGWSAWEPVLLMDGDTPVGFSMYGFIEEPKYARCWFDRLLIDSRFQGRGYGRQAVKTVLGQMGREFPGRDIYLSVYEDNPVAIGLYRSFGFRFNGELDTKGEKVMVLEAEAVKALL